MKIKKKTAAIYVILIIALLLCSTFYPLRLYSENVLIAGSGETALVSDVIDQDNDAGIYFLAQRSHLQFMEIRIEEVLEGAEMIVQLFGHAANGGFELLAEEEIPFPETGSGFVRVPVDVELAEGEEYVYTLRGKEDARFRTAFEVVDLSGNPDVPAYRLGFYRDTGIPGVAVTTKFGYRIPLGNRKTAAALLSILAMAGILTALCLLYYKRNPARNTETTVRKVLACTLTPAVLFTGAAAAVMIWPLQLFDDRIADILIYETGTAVFVITCLYALWHKRRADLPQKPVASASEYLPHLILILLTAEIFDQCAKYMNALNDFEHHRSEAMIISLISGMVMIMCRRTKRQGYPGRLRVLLNVSPLIILAACSVPGMNYYRAHMAGADDPQYEIINEVLRYQIVSNIMLAGAVFCIAAAVLRALYRSRHNGAGVISPGDPGISTDSSKEEGSAPVHKTGQKLFYAGLYLITLVFFLMLYVNRYGRDWVTELIVMYALLFAAYLMWPDRRLWLRDLCAGIILNFLAMAAYSMLHRYYFAYYYSRFSMHFHTVTVTAYYLLLPEAASLTLLLMKWKEVSGTAASARERIRCLWKEFLVFSAVTSYLLMSLSRAGIFIAFLLIVASPFFVFSTKKDPVIRPVIRLLAMAMALIIVFPMIFTGQRIISTVVHRPERFEALEPYPDAVLRNPQWDSRWFMSIEVFTEMLLDRVIGGPASALSEKIKSGDDGQWVENDPRLSGEYGLLQNEDSVPEEQNIQASMQQAYRIIRTGRLSGKGAGRLLTADPGWEMSGLEEGDYSNGRLELYRAYLDEIEMTGHTHMGAALPNGDLAVHAHNIFLQTAFDSGIPTGIMLLVFGLTLFAASIRYYQSGTMRKDRYCLLPVLVVAGFGLTGMVEWIFHFCNPFTVMLMMSVLPVLDWRSYEKS